MYRPALPENPLKGNPRFEQVRFINRGAQGFVILAADKSNGGQQVALKFIERGRQINKYIERECINQRRLQHPNVVRLLEVFLTDEFLVLVMEYAAGGDLFRRVSTAGGLPEAEACWYFAQIVMALDYCHQMGVANRDVKLENTLLDGGNPPRALLADFGFSKDEQLHSAPGSRVGTSAYLPPEVISCVHGEAYDAKKADVWSLGVLLYCMVTGVYPFGRAAEATQAPAVRLHNETKRIMEVNYTFPHTPQLSGQCRDLISKMLVKDPVERLTMQQVLQHPWTTQGLPIGALEANAALVAQSLANPPPPEVLLELEATLQKAQLLGRPIVPVGQYGAESSMGFGSSVEWDDDCILDTPIDSSEWRDADTRPPSKNE